MRITEHDLDQLYYDAFRTDERLPNAIRKQKLTFWMDMNRIDWLNYGDSEPKISLSPRSISRWELALKLILLTYKSALFFASIRKKSESFV